jgi:aromatic ring-opening dioxygenase catalytic subunit (LigB family)
MYDTHHPVYPKLQEIGLEITKKDEPRAVAAFSAHWQGELMSILANLQS